MCQEPPLHPHADTQKVPELQVQQAPGQILMVEHDQTVGLLQIGGHLGQHPVVRDADGTGQTRADLPGDPRLDLPGHGHGLLPRGEGGREVAFHLVDRLDFADMDARLDDRQQPVVVADVDGRTLLHEEDVRAQRARLGDARAHLHAPGLGRVAGRDAAGRLRQDGHYAQRPAAQLRTLLLLAGGEEGVEVDGESPEGHALSFCPRIGRVKNAKQLPCASAVR